MTIENHFPDIPSQYEETFSILHNIVITLNWKMRKLTLYDNPSYIKLMNDTAPVFFTMVKNLLIDSIILDLCNLTDSDKRNLNYQKLICLTIKHSELKVDINKLNKELGDLRKLIKPIRDQRNKRVSHLDDLVTSERYSGKQPLDALSYGLLKSSIQKTNYLMNAFLAFFLNSETIYDAKTHGDEIVLMNVLQTSTK